MTSNEIVFKGMMANLQEARKTIRTLQVTIPLYNLEDLDMMEKKTILEKIQWFKKHLKEIHTVTSVEIVLTEDEVRYDCHIFRQHDKNTFSFEEIETLFDKLQVKVAAIITAWDIFDYWTDLIVDVWSPQKSVK